MTRIARLGLCAFLFTFWFAPTAFAAGTAVNNLRVDAIFAGPGDYLRVYVKQHNDASVVLPTSCQATYGFAIVKNDPNYFEIHSNLMLAAARDALISIWIPNTDVCVDSTNNFVRVNRVTYHR